MTLITAATMNIAGSRNPRAVRELRSALDISVLGLQEVDRNAERSRFHDVASEIAGESAAWAFADAMRFGHLRKAEASGDTSYKAPATGTKNDALFGVALVSTYPFTHERIFLGPEMSEYWQAADRYTQREREPRSALVAKITIGPSLLWAISSHLAYTKDRDQPSAIRRNQLAILDRYIDTKIPENAPLIVMVDSNATPTNPDMQNFMKRFQFSPVLTYPVGKDEKPDRQIDYLLSRNLEEIGELRTFGDPAVSDHKLLYKTYRL